MGNGKPYEIDMDNLHMISGGSIRIVEGDVGGYEVFDSSTGKSYGVFDNFRDAAAVAKKNKISAMGTWGDDAPPLVGLWEQGKSLRDVREEEDRTHKADPIWGTGSFD